MTVAPDPATATAAYYAPRPCSALADKTVYGGRYRAYATRKDCTIFEVNNFQTQAHYDWLPDVFHKEQLRCCDLPGASGQYSTKCRVVEIYNDAAGAQWNPYLIGAGGNDVVRFRWAGTIRAEARRAWPPQARAIRCGRPALRDRASATSEPAMPSATSLSKALMTAVIAVAIGACSDEHSTPAAPSASAAPPPPPVSAAAAPTPTPTPMPTPSATASGPVHACPASSSGDGSLSKPCDAKGTARMMEVTWTGKMADGGPQFRVINKSPSVILYGKFVAYFYDKAGKQLDVKDAAGQAHPNQACVGNLFSGIMKPAEKAVITFSCVKKEHVPEGTVAVEGEMQMVGFADASEKKSEYYWRNNDLTPDKRPKGGAK